MATRRPIPLMPLVGAMVAGAALTGVLAWRLNLQTIESEIQDKRSGLKKLVLSGRIPPNEQVMEYLTARQGSLERRYQQAVAFATPPPLGETASADPQLHFQEQFHEVQRTLERLATARSMSVPELLGFPKELPPSDTVPRLLAQVSLIQETAPLVFESGVASLSAFKIEDPATVSGEGEEDPFLLRLPVRVRMTTTLPQLMKVLAALQRVNPLIDVLALRVVSGVAPEDLEVELLLSRYLVTAALPEAGLADTADKTAPVGRTKGPRGPRHLPAEPGREGKGREKAVPDEAPGG